MPIFKHEVLKDQMHRPFTTDKALERRFDIVDVGKTQFGDSYGVFISKRRDFAVIGIPGIRESDGENGIDVIGTVNFKTPMINGFGLIDISNLSQVLQEVYNNGVLYNEISLSEVRANANNWISPSTTK